jgi:hypothetical protein
MLQSLQAWIRLLASLPGLFSIIKACIIELDVKAAAEVPRVQPATVIQPRALSATSQIIL